MKPLKCSRCGELPETVMGGWYEHQYVQMFCTRHRELVVGGQTIEEAIARWNHLIQSLKK